MRVLRKTLTAIELLRLSTSGADCRYELVKGKLYEMPPAGGRHGSIAMTMGSLLSNYVRANRLGHVFAAETGFILRREPDTVRAPDASFVAKDRLPPGELPTGYIELAPDLAVEVVSPSETTSDVQEKASSWLKAGTKLVWTIDPATGIVTVYSSTGDVQRLSEEDNLDGGDVLPGFVCSIHELFA